MSKVDKPLPVVDIDKNIEAFFENPSGNYCLPDDRNASFDYCYNYFQGFRERGEISKIASPENIETSCFQIGFYLASWGMLRGSAFLSQKSAAHYSELIKYIAQLQEEFWTIDVGDYNKIGVAKRVLECEKQIRDRVSEGTGKKRIASETLTTKIMLGIFGNIPAFDSYFLKGFENICVNEIALAKIYDFYRANIKVIDDYKICTISFSEAKLTSN